MSAHFRHFFYFILIYCGLSCGISSALTSADEPQKAEHNAVVHEDQQSPEQKPSDQSPEKTEKRLPAQLAKVTVVIEGEVLQQAGIHEWAGKASKLVTEWYPKMDVLLQSDGYVPPKEITIIFRKMDGVAYTAGNAINISADWIHRQPGDFGMVAHELVHVIQSYPRHTGPGWVTEGIADYIRHAHYEPDVKLPRINPDRASYRDAYKTTAGFFIWIETTYGKEKEFVKKLNAAMRERTYKDEIFQELTGKSLDDLWKEYADTFRK
ncbi:MAG: basic secretory family protein [Planctomycetaceae bacterium]|jgi:Mor family transcriptional regulator|nr:basic secretory family protein [Planctomycetaceae bacterium]